MGGGHLKRMRQTIPRADNPGDDLAADRVLAASDERLDGCARASGGPRCVADDAASRFRSVVCMNHGAARHKYGLAGRNLKTSRGRFVGDRR